MRKYAEVHIGFVVGFHTREDERVPEFAGRSAIRVDNLATEPSIGDEWTGRDFISPTRPNPNLDPPLDSNREILEETRELVREILAALPGGSP